MSSLKNTSTAMDLNHIRDMVKACMQCGTCTGSCPNASFMDLTPRHMWRLVLLGDQEAVFTSHTFGLCSACYTCSLRCPRGLPLTDAMEGLKQIAVREHCRVYREGAAFYTSFLDSVRRYGRVRETEMMTRFFITLKNPVLPLYFAPLGLKLMKKHKIELKFPSKMGHSALEAIFQKVEVLEARK